MTSEEQEKLAELVKGEAWDIVEQQIIGYLAQLEDIHGITMDQADAVVARQLGARIEASTMLRKFLSEISVLKGERRKEQRSYR